jgi:hypothetical protein
MDVVRCTALLGRSRMLLPVLEGTVVICSRLHWRDVCIMQDCLTYRY